MFQQLGGRVLRVREMYDLYLKYMEIFSGNSLPEPQVLSRFPISKSWICIIETERVKVSEWLFGMDNYPSHKPNNPLFTQIIRPLFLSPLYFQKLLPFLHEFHELL